MVIREIMIMKIFNTVAVELDELYSVRLDKDTTAYHCTPASQLLQRTMKI